MGVSSFLGPGTLPCRGIGRPETEDVPVQPEGVSLVVPDQGGPDSARLIPPPPVTDNG